jgi:hypothetical protein
MQYRRPLGRDEDTMRWIEIIHLRTSDGSDRIASALSDYSKKDVGKEPGLVEVKFYKHASFDGDMSFLFIWETEYPELKGSRYALSVSQLIKKIGLIKHSVWVEQSTE